MTTTIVTIAIVVVAILVWKHLTGRSKSRHEKSGTEVIASTLAGKINQSINDAAKGMRDADTVKAELLAKIDNANKKAKNDLAAYLKDILTTKETHAEIIARSTDNISQLEAKAKQLKAKYAETNDEKYKTYASRYLASIVQLENQVSQSSNIIEQSEDSLFDARFKFDNHLSNIELRRLEVLSLLSNPDTMFALDAIELSDLTLEFKEKMSEKKIQSKVVEILNENTATPSVPAVSDEDINNRWDKL